jgi:hypothetical protein
VVSDEATPRPLRKVRVTLNMVGSRGTPGKKVTTDDIGRFEFTGLPSGRFDLQAYKPDYVRTNYGARRPNRPGTPVPLADGERREGIVIPMARGAVIAGVVRDASGAPVPGVLVRTLSFGYSVLTGERTLGLESFGGYTRTDDRGAYRAWGLAAGEYIIKVDAPAEAPDPGLEDMRLLSAVDVQRVLASARNTAVGFANNSTRSTVSPAPGAPVTYTSIYYPGTLELAAARAVTLAAAEEREGVDVQMELVRTARIEGSVHTPEGAPVGALSLTLAPTFIPGQASLAQPDRPASTGADRNGRFSFGGVAPGHYTVTAKTSGTAIWWATADVVVDGNDLDVALDLQPPMTVNGRLLFEGGTEPPKNFGGMRMTLVPLGSGSMISSQPNGGEVGADGRFQLRGVTPGVYWWVSLGGSAGALADWSMNAMSVDRRDASDGPLQIRPNQEIDWVITYHDHPTELAGKLQDASGRAASDYFVVVFSTDRAFWTPRSRRIQAIRPSIDGQFSVRGLPGGDYFIAALTDLATGEQNDPSLLSTLVSASLKVTLSEGQKTTQDLTLAGR